MLGIWTDRDNEEVLAAARIFPGFGQKERAVIRRAIHPPKPQWKIRQEEMDAEWDAQEKEEHRLAVASFMAIIPQIRTGDINGTYNPARVYLGLHLSGRGDTSKSSEERLAWFFNEALAKEFLVGFEATLHRSDLPSLSEISDSHSNGKIWNFSYPLIAGLLERQLSGRGFAEIASGTLRKALLICAQQRQGIGPDKDITELRMALEHAVAPKVEDKQALLRYWVEQYLNPGPSPYQELQGIEHIPLWCEAVASLAREWLVRYSQMSLEAEMELANALARAGDFVAIVEVAKLRDLEVYRDEDHALAWLALDVVYRFDEIFMNLSGVGRDHPEFLWLLRDRMQTRRRSPVTGGGLQVGEWIVSEFRTVYPYATMSGVSIGATNGFDATDFLKSLISRVSAHTSDDAAQLMVHLAAGPADNYSAEIKHLAAEQLQKRAEESFSPIAPAGLTAILTAGAPTNIDDFRSLIVEELCDAQKVLLGDDLDQIRDFWTNANIPRDENRCRDRLAALIERPLADMYGVSRMPEADMPHSKRVDLAFARGRMQIPMEIKGQWHDDVWNAANSQLASQYLIDWRSEGRGIYCVLWFGDVPSATGRRLKVPPVGVASPLYPTRCAMRSWR